MAAKAHYDADPVDVQAPEVIKHPFFVSACQHVVNYTLTRGHPPFLYLKIN
jgi:hypothetical protein